MNKTIAALGTNELFYSENLICCSSQERRSLLDADIILYSPSFFSWRTYSSSEQLSGVSYMRFMDDIDHWQTEKKKAIQEGKTIFQFCSRSNPFTLNHGENNIEPFDPLAFFFPCSNYRIAHGEQIRYCGNKHILRSLWEEFKSYFFFNVLFEEKEFAGDAYFAPRKCSEVCGGIIKSSTNAHIVALPGIWLKDENHSNHWGYSDENIQLSIKFIECLINVDNALKASTSLTPPPTWINKFQTVAIEEGRARLKKIEEEETKIKQERINAEQTLESRKIFQNLLFEKGKPLEEGVKCALKLIGFKAESYQDSDSEFDVILNSEEGTFIGEIEGKDNRPLNVRKISQLMRNIAECLDKDTSSKLLKGILFGNAYRFKNPSERDEQFTPKCIKTAKQQEIALVRTIDLFRISQYLLQEKDDQTFATKCREIIIKAKGIVSFPPIPKPIK